MKRRTQQRTTKSGAGLCDAADRQARQARQAGRLTRHCDALGAGCMPCTVVPLLRHRALPFESRPAAKCPQVALVPFPDALLLHGDWPDTAESGVRACPSVLDRALMPRTRCTPNEVLKHPAHSATRQLLQSEHDKAKACLLAYVGRRHFASECSRRTAASPELIPVINHRQSVDPVPDLPRSHPDHRTFTPST